MFKLPRCPHCGMHYSYKKVISGRVLGEKRCTHCEKAFRAVRSASTWLFVAGMFLLCLLINFILLRALDVNGLFISFVTIFLIIPACAVVPLTIRYRDQQGSMYAGKNRNPIGRAPDQAPPEKQGHKPSKSVRRRQAKQSEQAEPAPMSRTDHKKG